jgi:hypothetical protein
MICDDHEITDDWNINKKWCDEVDKSSCGKQIISNGLLAYWAFQAWGNDPDSFDDYFIEKIKHYLKLKKQLGFSRDGLPDTSLIKQSGSSFDPKNETLESSMIRDLEKNILMSKNWTFVAPTTPLSVFLDCRTQRTFVDEEGPPHLLSEHALEHIKLNLQKSGYKNGDPLAIISPTPVFGFELAESVQRFLTSISGSYKWDLETWRANEIGFAKFLTYIANNFDPIYCIFLSGDVHYAFTMKASLDHLRLSRGIESLTERGGKTQEKTLIPMAQLTSSPFRSNSLRNRIVAILILNLIHKVIVSKEFIFRKAMEKKSSNNHNFNYDYFKRLPDISGHQSIFNYDVCHKHTIHFSKIGDDKSILEKIKLILSNLVKFLKRDKSGPNLSNSTWTEHRLLIKPKGQCSLPVLARNNIGHVSFDFDSKILVHKLYYLENDDLRHSEALINFEI